MMRIYCGIRLADLCILAFQNGNIKIMKFP